MSEVKDGTKENPKDSTGRDWDAASLMKSASQNKPDRGFKPESDPKSENLSKSFSLPDTKISSDWTLAIDLRADRSVAPASKMKFEQLKELADKTKNSSVIIVAQMASEGPKISHADFSAGKTSRDRLERYMIRDGKVSKIFDGDSSGIAEDTKELLRTATREAPSDKIGYILASHGATQAGVEGFGGSCSLDDLSKSIAAGLEGSGKTKLDVIDFDACVMGNAKVLEKMQGRTDNVVASTEPECDDIENKQFLSQNLGKTVEKLLANPTMTGNELAKDFVEEAKSGVNDGDSSKSKYGFYSGTRTLSQYDLAKLPGFESMLNEFGKNLSVLLKDPESKKQIQEAVSGTRTVEEDSEHRDLKPFMSVILDKIESGKLADPSGSLKRSITELMRSEGELVQDYRGTTRGGYDKWGGLSVFLPSRESFGSGQTDSAARNSKRDRGAADVLDGAPEWSAFAASVW